MGFVAILAWGYLQKGELTGVVVESLVILNVIAI
jgi:hypothetical protein